MIYGIGTDIVSVARIRSAVERHGERFAKRLLTSVEWADYCRAASPAHFLAKRFAVKEAVGKALGTGIRGAVCWKNIVVVHDGLGKPMLVPQGNLARFIQDCGVTRTSLSISDERDTAIAFVVFETEVSR